MGKNYSGGCSCGGVRYTLLDEPMFTHCCHCHLCQQITGSAFITNTLIEGSNFKITSGQPASFSGASGSGRNHTIKRCPNCGDPIVSYFGDTEHLAVVKAGTLDDLNLASPQAHVFVDTKVEWLELPSDTPAFEDFYDFEKTWPETSFKRLTEIRRLGWQASSK
jgi:hypothetical protein